MRRKVAVIAGVIVLLLVNLSIIDKEQQLKEGRVVYLELAPVDPRSLMQGDYMALRFAVANEVYQALPRQQGKHGRRDISTADGRVVITLDDKLIGKFKRLEDDAPLAGNEVVMRYRVRDGQLKFATNAFFFQEGHAKIYEAARYGQFRVDQKGELLLANLFDKDLNKLVPNNPDH